MAPGSMNLTQLQNSADIIASLLDHLEEGDKFDESQPSSRIPSKAASKIAGSGQDQIVSKQRTVRLNSDGSAARPVIESKKAVEREKAHNDGSDGDVSQASTDSAGSDFLNFEPRELGGVFEPFNIVVSKKHVDELLHKFRTAEKLEKTKSIAEWFTAAVIRCRHGEDGLDDKEIDLKEEAEGLQSSHDQLHDFLEGRSLNCVTSMRRFYKKAIQARTGRMDDKKKVVKKKQKLDLDVRSEANEKDRSEERRLRLLSEMSQGKGSKERSSSSSESEDEDDGDDLSELGSDGSTPKSKSPGGCNSRKSRKKTLRQMSSQVSIGSSFTRRMSANSSRQSQRGSNEFNAHRSHRPHVIIPEAEIAAELLEVISSQQEEIAQFRSQADVDILTTKSLKEALEYTRCGRQAQQEATEEALKKPIAKMGGEGAHRQAQQEATELPKMTVKKPIALSESSQEVLDAVTDQLRMKCINEMLYTKEGRDLLEKCVGDGKSKIMEAHSKACAIIDETEELKRQVEELEQQLEAVGEREEREEFLKVEVAKAQAAKAEGEMMVEQFAGEVTGPQAAAVVQAKAQLEADIAVAHELDARVKELAYAAEQPGASAEVKAEAKQAELAAAEGKAKEQASQEALQGSKQALAAAEGQENAATAAVKKGKKGRKPSKSSNLGSLFAMKGQRSASISSQGGSERASSKEHPSRQVSAAASDASSAAGSPKRGALGRRRSSQQLVKSSTQVLVAGPRASWLPGQRREVQHQVNTVTRNMEKVMDNVKKLTHQMTVRMEDALEAAVDEVLEHEQKQALGITEVAVVDETKQEQIDAMKSNINRDRVHLEEVRSQHLSLQEHELEQRQTMRNLKKVQKEQKGIAEGDEGSSRVSDDAIGQGRRGSSKEKEARRGSSQTGRRGSSKEKDGRRGSSQDGRKKSSGALAPGSSMEHQPSGGEHDGAQASDKRGSVMAGRRASSKDKEGSGEMGQDIHVVRGEIKIVEKEVSELERKENRLKRKMYAIIRKKTPASERDGGKERSRRNGSKDTARTSSKIEVTDVSLEPDRSRQSRSKFVSTVNEEPDASAAERVEIDSAKESSRSRRGVPGTPRDTGKRSSQEDSSIEKVPQGSEGGDTGGGDSGAARSRGSLLSVSSVTKTGASSIPGEPGKLQPAGAAAPDQLDSAAQAIVDKAAATGARLRRAPTQPEVGALTTPVVIDKREQQIKELLSIQSENLRLGAQIAGIEKQIKDAKVRAAHPGGVVPGAGADPAKKDPTVPEENRAMRREVIRRQRELNLLRKRWHEESDKHKKGAYEGNVPGQIEAAIRLLLRDPPKLAAVQAKAEEEAVQRAADEAKSLAVAQAEGVKEEVVDASDANKEDKVPERQESSKSLGATGDLAVGGKRATVNKADHPAPAARRSQYHGSDRSSLKVGRLHKQQSLAEDHLSAPDTVASLVGQSVHGIGSQHHSHEGHEKVGQKRGTQPAFHRGDSGQLHRSDTGPLTDAVQGRGHPVMIIGGQRRTLNRVSALETAPTGWHQVPPGAEAADMLTVAGTGSTAARRKSAFHHHDEASRLSLLKGQRPLEQFDRVQAQMASSSMDLGLHVHKADVHSEPQHSAEHGPQQRNRTKSVMMSKMKDVLGVVGPAKAISDSHTQAQGSDHHQAPSPKKPTPRRNGTASAVDIGAATGWTAIDQSSAAQSSTVVPLSPKEAPQRRPAPPVKTTATENVKDAGKQAQDHKQPHVVMPEEPVSPKRPAASGGATDVALNALKAKLNSAGWAKK